MLVDAKMTPSGKKEYLSPFKNINVFWKKYIYQSNSKSQLSLLNKTVKDLRFLIEIKLNKWAWILDENKYE